MFWAVQHLSYDWLRNILLFGLGGTVKAAEEDHSIPNSFSFLFSCMIAIVHKNSSSEEISREKINYET